MKLIDLFAGIGGFSLAAHWMGWETVAFVEWEPYCQEVLKKNFSNVPVYGDIKEFDGTKYKGAVDIVCGGFPCQPFSTAGVRKGKEDDRHLWPEMLRVVREAEPTWVIGENVRGIVSMDNGAVLEEVCTDLENSGYSVQPFIIPSIGIGAPHRRERVWIIAHRNESGAGICDRQHKASRQGRESGDASQSEMVSSRNRKGNSEGFESCDSSPDSGRSYERGRSRRVREENEGKGVQSKQSMDKSGSTDKIHRQANCDTKRKGLERENRLEESKEFEFGCRGSRWETHWIEAATSLCRVDDGIPGGLDETGGVPSKPKNKGGRRHRLKALGNAVQPDLVYEIFKIIDQYGCSF